MGENGVVQKAIEDPAWLRAIGLTSLCCLPMALKVAIKLNVMEILAHEPSQLSACELVALMKTKYQLSISNPMAHVALDRILRVLASHDVLSSSLQHLGDSQLPVLKYGLTAISQYLVSGPQGLPSLAPMMIMNQHKVFMDTWQFLEQAVLEGGEAFTLAHGKNTFLLAQGDPLFDGLFNTTMANHTKLFIPLLLESYDGFLGVNTLVDVGGGVGACLSAIVSKYPHIKGINYDQPHVVESAPKHAGVEHVGGDMFKSIPEADTIFIKYVLHDWSNELCVKILKNCYKALPQKGKVIVVDALLPSAMETTLRARANFQLDLFMLANSQGGRERNEKELRDVASAAGFKEFRLITILNENIVVELHKL